VRAPSTHTSGLAALAAAFVLALAGCGGAVLPQIRSESDRLAVARQMLAQRDYVQAIELLKTYVAANPGSAEIDEAIYLLGEAYLRTKDWPSAQIEFERVLRDYPESDSSAAASFQLGEALYGQARKPDFDQDNTRRALAQFETYAQAYPGHWLQPEAQRRIGEARRRLAEKYLDTAELYLKLELGEPAIVWYQRLLEELPDTPQAGEATIGIALAKAVMGRKAEAIAELRGLETTYAGQPIAARAARERERLER
jgi:outer membrane assembly lipoprotein YfiO